MVRSTTLAEMKVVMHVPFDHDHDGRDLAGSIRPQLAAGDAALRLAGIFPRARLRTLASGIRTGFISRCLGSAAGLLGMRFRPGAADRLVEVAACQGVGANLR